MKILFYYKYFPNIGGVERVIAVLANEFIRQGHEVGIVSFCHNASISNYEIDKRVKLYYLPNNGILSCDENIEDVCRIMKQGSYQILFNHDSVSDSVGFVWKIRQRYPCKLVTLHHGAIFMNKKTFLDNLKHSKDIKHHLFYHFGVLAFILKMCQVFLHHRSNIRKCDKYVCLCELYRKQLYCARKTKAIYNPLSYSSYLDENEFENKENYVLFVGRLSEWHKRLTVMLDIWKKVSPKDWRLLIVGDGPDKKIIENYVEFNDVKNVYFEGFQQPESYYKKSKIFLMTSSVEGFPMTMSEAKQFGCVPIAMNSFGAIKECIKDGKDGFIVPNNDIDDFSCKLKKLIHQPSLLKKMAFTAIENSKSRSASFIVGEWGKLFMQLINEE